MKKIVAALTLASLLSACATAPENVSASYVSPLQYQAYDCSQLGAEMERIGNQVDTLTGQQRKERRKDQVAFAAGMVLFWPALFFMAGSDKKEELGRLKGEHDAVQKAAIERKCPGAVAV
jgi:hypothetical protein